MYEWQAKCPCGWFDTDLSLSYLMDRYNRHADLSQTWYKVNPELHLSSLRQGLFRWKSSCTCGWKRRYLRRGNAEHAHRLHIQPGLYS